jgi:competence protein ComEA
MPEKPSEKQPNFWERLSDTLFVRHADQTIVAALVLAAIIGVGLWWWRNGGAEGRLVEHDRLPQHEAKFMVDVNQADEAELAELPGVGPTLAQRIIAHRREQGPFQSFDDLKQVKGIGDKTLEQLRPHVSFGEP